MSRTVKIVASVFAFLLPFLFIFGSNLIWPSGPKDGACVIWRPDGVTYSVAWIFLILCIGFSWTMVIWFGTTENIIVASILFGLILLMTTFWQWRYHVNKKDGITIFLFLLFFLAPLIAYLSKINVYSQMALLPLLIWSVFQLAVNIEEIKCLSV